MGELDLADLAMFGWWHVLLVGLNGCIAGRADTGWEALSRPMLSLAVIRFCRRFWKA